jgi:methyl-accepting chemotaxis protein PixJ
MNQNTDKYNFETVEKSALTHPTFWWKIPSNTWNNLPIRSKITTLLVVGAIIPVIAVTQGIVEVSRQEALGSLKSGLSNKLSLLAEAIDTQKSNLEINANTLALSVQTANIDLKNPSNIAANSQKLQSLIAGVKAQQPNASFYIITDDRGRTVAQFVQSVNNDGAEYPLLPTTATAPAKFAPVQTASGIDLADVPIVSDALKLDRSLSGVELLPSQILSRLGLDKQANIGIRQQKTQGLAEAKQPYPVGEFEIDRGKMGLTLIAVKPIKLGQNRVGTAIVGTLVNRNFELVDRLKQVTGVSTATLFAQDWRVSTNVAYTDNQTRAIGTRVSREVADTVLKQSQVFIGNTNIIGVDYVAGYSPIYSHRQQIDGKAAKPIGIAYVGEPQTQVIADLGKITLAGYTVGGLVLGLFGVILIIASPDKYISRPLKGLSKFATQIAAGEPGVRLEVTDRQDEIGILTYNLNEMAKNIDANLATRENDAQQQREQREQLEQGIYTLLDEVGGAMDGDLTVRASLLSMDMSTVADLFNAIIDSLQEIAIEAKQSTNHVGVSLNQNVFAIQALSDRSITEAAATRDTLNSVEQISQSIQAVASNASQAAQISEETYSTALKSSGDMELTVDSILSLRTTVGETAKKMKRLGESSQKISQVVSLMEEIALKTNLLAINASVEAGRAGEQGQGFTIVAEQVGALAEQSSVAAKEIAKMVAAIQLETQEVSKAMESGTTQVVDSTRLIESTKQSLELVLEKSQAIDRLMRSISETTVSQASTSQSITTKMQQIAERSEQSSVSSQHIASSISATAQVAQNLESTVAKFKVAKSDDGSTPIASELELAMANDRN